MQIDSWKDEDFRATPYELFFFYQNNSMHEDFVNLVFIKRCVYEIALGETITLDFAQILPQLERDIAYES